MVCKVKNWSFIYCKEVSVFANDIFMKLDAKSIQKGKTNIFIRETHVGKQFQALILSNLYNSYWKMIALGKYKISKMPINYYIKWKFN